MSLLMDAINKSKKPKQPTGLGFVKTAAQTESRSFTSYFFIIFIALFIVCSTVWWSLNYVKNHHSAPKAVSIMTVQNKEASAFNQRYKKAMGYINNHKYAEAIALLNNDQMISATQGQSAIALARIYLQLGLPRRSEETVRNAMTYHTVAQNDLVGMLGQILFNQGRYEETVGTLKSISPPIDQYPGFYGLLARAYIKLDNPKPAENLFQQLIAKSPDKIAWWLGFALALQEDQQYPEAKAAYQHAKTLETTDPQVSLFIQNELQQINSVSEASNAK